MKSLKGYVGRYIVLSLRQTVQLNFGYIIRLYNDGIPYCGGIKTWDFTAICQRNSLLPDIALHVQGRVHRVPLQNQRRNQDSTWHHHSLYQRPLEATCYSQSSLHLLTWRERPFWNGGRWMNVLWGSRSFKNGRVFLRKYENTHRVGNKKVIIGSIS